MIRHAVLWDLDAIPDALPCGVAYETPEGLRIVLPGDGWGIRELMDDEFHELGPDGETTTRPGDPDYFERALYSLHRTFAITIPEYRRRDDAQATRTGDETDLGGTNEDVSYLIEPSPDGRDQ